MIVECVRCRGTGKNKEGVPSQRGLRLVYVHTQCELCGGHGYIRIKTPSAEWRKLADEAQILARKALGK